MGTTTTTTKSKKPKISPEIGLGIGGLGTSVLGSIFNWFSQRNANRTNLRIAQMNNEFNEHMMEKQMMYNTEMWERQNEYNSAENQFQRFKNAGLNPYSFMNGGDAGTASSVASPGMPTAQGVQVSAPTFDTHGIMESINYIGSMLTSGFNQKQQGIGTGIDNETRGLLNWEELQLLRNQANKELWEGRKSYQEFKLMQEGYDFQLNQLKLNNYVTNSQIAVNMANRAVMYWDSRVKESIAQYCDDMQIAELALKAADLVKAVNEGRVAEKTAELIIEQTLEVQARTREANSRVALNEQEYDIRLPEMYKGQVEGKWLSTKVAAKNIINAAKIAFENDYTYQVYRLPEFEALTKVMGNDGISGVVKSFNAGAERNKPSRINLNW